MPSDKPKVVDSRVPPKKVLGPVREINRWDPRFDEAAGSYNHGMFKKAYDFLYQMRGQEQKNAADELKNIKTKMKRQREGDPEGSEDEEDLQARHAEAKRSLQQLRAEGNSEKRFESRQKQLKEIRKVKNERGLRPIVTKKEVATVALREKFEQLDKSEKRKEKVMVRAAKKRARA